MRRRRIVVILTIVTSLRVVDGGLRAQDGVSNQQQLQQKIDSLKIGVSDLHLIEQLFGEPASLREGVDWHDAITGKSRAMHDADYPTIGLSFSLFTNPSQLYSITIETKEVVWRSIRIGDNLLQVRKTLGEQGEWGTTEKQEWWWLEFKTYGVRVRFERDKAQEKYPIKLAKPETVTKIELYDQRVAFR